jgi:hypothetical protein
MHHKMMKSNMSVITMWRVALYPCHAQVFLLCPREEAVILAIDTGMFNSSISLPSRVCACMILAMMIQKQFSSASEIHERATN